MIYLAMPVLLGCEGGRGEPCRFLPLCEAAVRRQLEVLCEKPDEAAGVDASSTRPGRSTYWWVEPEPDTTEYPWWEEEAR